MSFAPSRPTTSFTPAPHPSSRQQGLQESHKPADQAMAGPWRHAGEAFASKDQDVWPRSARLAVIGILALASWGLVLGACQMLRAALG